MLTTNEAAKLLNETERESFDSDQIAELARNGVFPNAIKDSRGRWLIPLDDILSYINLRKKGRKRKRYSWITLGTIVTIITILSIISIIKDALDITTGYIAPSPTPSATPLPPVITEKVLFTTGGAGYLHLGERDGLFGWPPLAGRCFDIKFTLEKLPVSIELRQIKTFEADADNSIILNGQRVAYLPAHIEMPGFGTHYWSDPYNVSLPVDTLHLGQNTLSICSEKRSNPTKYDDFQIDRILLVGTFVDSETPVVPLSDGSDAW